MRIVSLFEGHIRPIVHGTTCCNVDFDARISTSNTCLIFSFLVMLSYDHHDEGQHSRLKYWLTAVVIVANCEWFALTRSTGQDRSVCPASVMKPVRVARVRDDRTMILSGWLSRSSS
jgi:hypothetical protein